MSDVLFWTLVGFFAGSIPFSLILGKQFAGIDIRTVADGNPGAMNAIRAGGWKVGVPAVILDVSKGYLPIVLARHYGLSNWELVPVALAPIMGHAFTPFLRFHGGKALGATGGVWLALIGLWTLPAYAILTLPVLALQVEHAWAANAGMLSLLGYAIWVDGSPWLIVFALLNVSLIAWTHRRDLVRRPQLRPWAADWLTRRSA